MPPVRRKRCVFKESGRRCPRDGDGDPPLCRAHQVAFARAATPRRPTEVVNDLFQTVIQGRPLSGQDIAGAVGEIFGTWAMGGGIAPGYHPDVNPSDRESQVHQRRHRFDPPPNYNWWPGGGGPRAAAPPSPPVDEDEIARQRARQVMGFTSDETLDEATISARKRKLAKEHHPDRGGRPEKMAEINDAADILMAAL